MSDSSPGLFDDSPQDSERGQAGGGHPSHGSDAGERTGNMVARGVSSIPAAGAHVPLAEAMRPRHIDEVVGQRHLLDAGKPLRVALAAGEPHSMLFWGPPGVGKTTLARLLANQFDAGFIAISAVLGGVKEIRAAIDQAREALAAGRQTILFVDEVHRFNKAQQDAFLPHVESGLVTFIGATTENPSFEVNGALLSRARVYVLEALDEHDLRTLLERAGAHLKVAFESDAITRLIAYSDGDARRLLNTTELAAQAARAAMGQGSDGAPRVSLALLENTLGRDMRRFDKGGDQFYDQISALHKSVRGSDPDASLYWFCRMLDGGTDPRYLARRLIRIASEDIGLADVRAMRICLDAAEVYERLGSPEGELALAEAVVFLACAAKSNRVYTAFGAAMAYAREHGSAPVPMHIRNAPTKLMKELGHGEGYRYAHDEPDGVAQGETYFPSGLGARFYEPTDRGLEAAIGEKLRRIRGE